MDDILGIKTKAFIRRFLKGFIGGGLATVLATAQMMPPILSWGDLKVFSFSLIVGFFTGGLLATEKMLSWKE